MVVWKAVLHEKVDSKYKIFYIMMPIVKTHRLSKVNMYWICYSFLLQQVYYKNIKDAK